MGLPVRVDDHAGLVRLGYSRAYSRFDRAAFLAASGWVYDDGLDEWRARCGLSKGRISDAVTIQVMTDAVRFLLSRGWGVDAYFTGSGDDALYYYVLSVLPPGRKRGFVLRTGLTLALAAEGGAPVPDRARPRRESRPEPTDAERVERELQDRWNICAATVRTPKGYPVPYPPEDPRPLARLVAFNDPPAGLAWVTDRSAASYRLAVYALAHYIKREEGYDFVPFGWRDVEPSTHAFLWFDRSTHTGTNRAFGAAVFSSLSGSSDVSPDDRWVLQWVWIHPLKRRSGVLRAAWPFFERVFGAFQVQPPYSRAMTAFLAKNVPRLGVRET